MDRMFIGAASAHSACLASAGERARALELFDAHLPVLRAEKGDGHPWTRRAADRAVALYRAIGDRTRELALATIVERR